MGDWLTVRHLVHVVLAFALVIAILRKAWSLYVRSGIDIAKLRQGIRRERLDPHAALRDLWGVTVEDGLRVAIEDAQEADQRGIWHVAVLTKLTLVTGVVFGLYEFIWMLQGEHGLLALKAGYVERLSMGRIAIHLALGLGALVVGKTANARMCVTVRWRAQILRDWMPEEPVRRIRRR